MAKKKTGSKNKNEKLWGGGYDKATAHVVERLSASVHYDRRLAPYDIMGSIAHVEMLSAQKIISAAEGKKIVEGLKKIARRIEKDEFVWDPGLEDVHMNIEAALIKEIGEVGKKVHTARSRNDQVALDERLMARDVILQVQERIIGLAKALVDQAEANSEAILPGYTHLQQAQPVLFAHHLLAYVAMISRDFDRLGDAMERVNVLPLGSAALAGTTLPIDRAAVAEKLNFAEVSENSMDSVSDRDFLLEILFDLSLLMVHLSRLCEDMILWSSSEFGYVSLDESVTTGSSIMPQKRNPDVCELVRGKTGRVVGDLVSLLTVLKGLPMTYNRDLQEDKEPFFDAADTVTLSLEALTLAVATMRINDFLMEASIDAAALATDLAEYAVTKGMPFREAHGVIARLVRDCDKKMKTLDELTEEELTAVSPLLAGASQVLDARQSVTRRNSYGGTSPKEVRRQIKNLKKDLGL